MHPIRHSLMTLWTRYRWEVLAYAVTVILSGIAHFTSLEPDSQANFVMLETLGLFWLTLRLLLADDGFKTHGGWQARPINPRHLLIAQLVILGLITLLPLGWHSLVIRSLFQPSDDQWNHLLGGGFRRAALGWLAFAICVKLFSLLILRPLEGIARKAAWSVLIVVLVPIMLFTLPKSALRTGSGHGGSSRPPGLLSTSIQNQLPQVTEFIGEWNDQGKRMVPQARLALSVALDDSHRTAWPGLRINETNHAPDGLRTSVRVSMESLEETSFGALASHGYPVLLFDNGMAATCLRHTRHLFTSGSSFLPIHGFEFRASFYSPASLPENQGTNPARFKPTHLLFYLPDSEKTEIIASLDRQNSDDEQPTPPLSIPNPTDKAAFDLAVRQLIDSTQARKKTVYGDLIPALIEALPPEAMDPILSYRPWPDSAWESMILPFLKKHATPGDQPILLERLAHDPRLSEIFIDKGWTEDAIPVLRQRAEQGLPLDPVSLKLLAAQGDPELNDDLAKLALQLNKDVGELAPELRQIAGFDWPGFVAEGWTSRKYGRYDKEGWRYALWAAELGDHSALRRLAEEAAAGKKWEREHLIKLLPSAPRELLPYLRENLNQLHYKPSEKAWDLRVSP